MVIPKEIREKIEEKLRINEEIKEFFKENEEVEGLYFDTIKIVDKPKGRKQQDGEYCDQSRGYCEDDFYGYYYWPTDNGKYVCMYYEC